MLHPQLRIEQVAAPYDQLLPPGGLITVQALPFHIGRGLSNGLRIDHPDVSRRHACLRLLDDYYWVEDLGSRNGTLLNRERLPPNAPRRLETGDAIQLAAALRLVFLDPAATQRRPHVLPLAVHGLWLDAASQLALVGGEPVPLPPTQFQLLALLYARPGVVVTRAEIAQALWGIDAELAGLMIDNTVSRLRAALEKAVRAQDHPRHEYIVTVRGLGYRFVPLPPD